MRKDDEFLKDEALGERQLGEVEASRERHELEVGILKYVYPGRWWSKLLHGRVEQKVTKINAWRVQRGKKLCEWDLMQYSKGALRHGTKDHACPAQSFPM